MFVEKYIWENVTKHIRENIENDLLKNIFSTKQSK